MLKFSGPVFSASFPKPRPSELPNSVSSFSDFRLSLHRLELICTSGMKRPNLFANSHCNRVPLTLKIYKDSELGCTVMMI